MDYSGLRDFLGRGRSALAEGPVALVLVEDLVEVGTTIRHNLNLGFKSVVLFAPPELDLPEDLTEKVHVVRMDVTRDGILLDAVNRVIAAAPGQWFFYGYNAEFLFFPFCETRTVGEMLTFHGEERRDAMLTYVIDLYAEDLDRYPDAVSLETALLDKSGYYALARNDEKGHPRERQLNFFGGLRWRFEEHVPKARRSIGRIALFRARPGLTLREDNTFNDEEYNTYSCPWHHNLTAAICSFRTAKALKSNSGSTFDIHSFKWHNSTEFEWTSQQLMELGLMEPGQWF
ncbi:MAG: hypothetical protein WCD16_03560 [Paracoccaceae bacterium]